MHYFINTAHAATFLINTNLPGPQTTSVSGFIQNFYTFALLISGTLAFGAIVWGGIRYATGRGNPSAESDGKSWITNALLGLLLLGGAWIILHTVNPALTNLNVLQLPALNAAPNGGASGSQTDACGGCPTGKTCQPFTEPFSQTTANACQ